MTYISREDLLSGRCTAQRNPVPPLYLLAELEFTVTASVNTNQPEIVKKTHSEFDTKGRTEVCAQQARTGKVRVRWSLEEFARVRERCKGGYPQPSISLALTKRPYDSISLAPSQSVPAVCTQPQPTVLKMSTPWFTSFGDFHRFTQSAVKIWR